MSKKKMMKGIDQSMEPVQKTNPTAAGWEAVNSWEHASGEPAEEASWDGEEAVLELDTPEEDQPDESFEDVCDEGSSNEEEAPEKEAEEETEGESSGLEEALKAAQAEREEYLNLAQRVQADFDNFRRRNQNVRREAFDDGARALVSALLPVVDNLERAMDAARESADLSLGEGVEMVCRQLLEVLEKRGVKPIFRLGEAFDPNLENAVLQGSPEEGEPGTVCEVFQKGYQMGNAVLRHAMVKVVPE